VTTTYRLEYALVDGAVHPDVLVSVSAGRFSAVSISPADRGKVRMTGDISPDKRGFPRPTGETVIRGLSIPGMANAHSHAFHRALRGRTQRERGTFWTWREQMYAVAGRLDPDSYQQLATAVFREMAAAGVTTVGEFHYLHHQPDGTAYTEANVMGEALVQAATDAGIRIALLDTCYLAAGVGKEPEGVQRRFSDGDARRWAERMTALADAMAGRPNVVVGGAVHSVRAVPRDQIGVVVETTQRRHAPLHVHLSEQIAENDQCLAAYGLTPTQLLHDEGALGQLTSAVHATHLTDTDLALLGGSGTYACFCPTTERDLGDGIGPSTRLHELGSRLTLGSDSHAVIDLFEEMRAVELDERLATQKRGHWEAGELIDAATINGQASLGFPDAGRIAVGHRADLITIDLTSPRTAGTGGDENTAVFAATAEDVVQVMVDGRVVVRQGDRQQVGRELDAAIRALWEEV
jgi:formiminoglutamate deiminase